MGVALVHDWLTDMRGGERCLEVFCDLVLSSSHCVAKGARLAPGVLRGSSAHQRSRLRLPSRRPTREVGAR
jgi:hypothetical protein